jgi:hypothetical protein
MGPDPFAGEVIHHETGSLSGGGRSEIVNFGV